jgi:ribosomal protein S18 acetylase RimI-like enzyme
VSRYVTHPSSTVEVSVATEVSDELVATFARLLPQLSASAAPLGENALAEIVAAPCNAVLLARDIADGGKIIGALTLVVFRIPTAVRAWIEDVVVDSSARGRGVGETLTREAVRLAVARGAQTIDLTSRPSRDAARRLYEKVGFTVRETNVYRYVPLASEEPANFSSSGRGKSARRST